MYAILQHGGHQYRVASGDRLVVDRLSAEIGEVIGLAPVLLIADGERIETRSDGLAGVRVAATVVAHTRGRKLRVFTYKPKKRHRRTLGFRPELTELLVERVLSPGEALPEPGQAEVAAAPEAASPETVEAPAAAAPQRRRGRRGAAAAAEPAAGSAAVAEAWGETEAPAVGGEKVAEAWGETSPAPTVEDAEVPAGGSARAEVPVEDSPRPAEEAVSAPDVAGEGEAPARRRRSRTRARAAEPSVEEPPPPGPEGGPPRGTSRRRVSRRTEPGEAPEE